MLGELIVAMTDRIIVLVIVFLLHKFIAFSDLNILNHPFVKVSLQIKKSYLKLNYICTAETIYIFKNICLLYSSYSAWILAIITELILFLGCAHFLNFLEHNSLLVELDELNRIVPDF